MPETGNYVQLYSFFFLLLLFVFISFSPLPLPLFGFALASIQTDTQCHGCIFIFVNFTAVAELVLGALTATKIFYVSFGLVSC